MKKKEEQELHDMLTALLERNFTEDELAMVAQQMKNLDEKGFASIMDETYYHYDRPDYAKMCKPVELYLHALYHAKTTEELVALLPRVLNVMEQQTQEEREQAVRNLLLNIMADFYREDGHVRELAMLGAFRMMEQYDMTALSDTLLELLRQNGAFTEMFVECNDSLFSLLISKLCRDQLPLLSAFAREEGLLPNGQTIVADAVIQMAIDHPERRSEVIAWVNDLLEHLAQPLTDPVTPNIDHIAASLLQLKAVETLPLLRKCYQTLRIPEIEVEGGYKRLKKTMAKGSKDRRVECATVQEFLDMYVVNAKKYKEEHADDDEDEEWDDDDEWDIDEDGPDMEDFGIEPLYKDNDKPLRSLTLSVTLNDAPVEITRELTVPSTLRLSHFAGVLIRAMGWEGYHLSIFVNGKTWYGDRFSVEQWREDGMEHVECYSDFTVGDVLPRKGSKVIWEYDLGDGWRHTIRVEESKPSSYGMRDVTLSKAKGACPPEDCGGVWGYANLIEIMADPSHPEHEEYKEWLGHKLQPGRFNIAKARKAIKDYLYGDLPF